MEILFILSWIALSIAVAFHGNSREIGFGGAFLIALAFSPIIGLIVATASAGKAQSTSGWHSYFREGQLLENRQRYQEALDKYIDALFIRNLDSKIEKEAKGDPVIQGLREKIAALNEKIGSQP